jgi:hypothetical protein
VVIFRNHYHHRVWLAFQWSDASCGASPWRIQGWWQFAPGEVGTLNIPRLPNDLRQVGNSHFYYFVEADDGAVWSGEFGTWCPHEGFEWCDGQTSATARLLGFREVINTQPDLTIAIGPNVNPVIDVRTERHQLGGWVTVTGDSFTPFSNVHIWADDLIGAVGPIAIGSNNIDINGHFQTIIDARCWPRQVEWVTIRAVDYFGIGKSATGQTSAYSCG